MSVFKAIGFAAAAYCGIATAASYPAEHPFENEAVIPPKWHASTPDLSFTQDDPGGYVYTYGEMMKFTGGTLTEEDLPYCFYNNGFYMFLDVHTFEMPPIGLCTADDCWNNCTAFDFIFKDSDFTGIVAGQQVCEVGSCCDGVIGQHTYASSSEYVLDNEPWFTDRVLGSKCELFPWEDIYCMYVGGDFHINCMNFVPGVTDRHFTVPCYDTDYLFCINCKVFAVEFDISYKKEPDSYYSVLTNDGLIAHDAFQFIQDRVCRPYSYYFPSSSPSSTTATSESDAAASTGFGQIITGFLATAIMLI